MNRYRNTIGQNTTNDEGKVVSFVGVKYPDIPYTSGDIYVYTTAGDRLDNLAKQFYGSSEYYWVISVANPDLGMGSLYVPEGTQIRIPGNLSNIILSFQLLNNQ